MEPRQVRRIGLIGIGKHGSRYARHIRDDCPEVEIAALCRRDPTSSTRQRANSVADLTPTTGS